MRPIPPVVGRKKPARPSAFQGSGSMHRSPVRAPKKPIVFGKAHSPGPMSDANRKRLVKQVRGL